MVLELRLMLLGMLDKILSLIRLLLVVEEAEELVWELVALVALVVEVEIVVLEVVQLVLVLDLQEVKVQLLTLVEVEVLEV